MTVYDELERLKAENAKLKKEKQILNATLRRIIHRIKMEATVINPDYANVASECRIEAEQALYRPMTGE